MHGMRQSWILRPVRTPREQQNGSYVIYIIAQFVLKNNSTNWAEYTIVGR